MNVAKEGAIALIRSLPDDCTIEDIQQYLAVYRKVEAGRVADREVTEGEEADFTGLPFFGMWSDRNDLPEAVDQVREGREAWRGRLSRTD